MAEITPGKARDDIGSMLTTSLATSRADTMAALDSSQQLIETANQGLAQSLQSSNELTNKASMELLDALRVKKDLAETPKIFKGIMTLLGNENYNENFQNLRIQEANAQLGVAAKRLDAGKEAHAIALQSAQFGVDRAVQEHQLKRQSVFDAFSIAQNLDEEGRRQLAGMSDDVILDGIKNPGNLPQFLQGKKGLLEAELRKRKSDKLAVRGQEQSVQLNEIALRDRKKDEAISKLTNDEIAAITSGKMEIPAGLDARDIEATLEKRQASMLSLESARQSVAAGNIELAEKQIDQALKNYSAYELQLIQQEADKKGGTIKLNGVTISSARLATMISTKKSTERELRNAEVKRIAENEANQANLNVVETQLNSLANVFDNKQLPADVKAKVVELDGQIKFANSVNAPDVAREKITALKELAKKETEKYVKSLPKEVQPAAEEYIQTGRINRPENQFKLLGTSLSNTALMTDNPILDPVWRRVSQQAAVDKARVSEGLTLGNLHGSGGEGEEGSGSSVGNIFISQPKKAEDDVIVQRAIAKPEVRAKEVLANTLFEKALAFTLNKLHAQAVAEGINDPWGQYIQVVNGEPELKSNLYTSVPLNKNNPNGPTAIAFNSQKIWEDLGAMSARDIAANKLWKGANYGEDLANAIRDNLDDFHKSIEHHLHSSMEASALSNLITGGHRGVRTMLLDKLVFAQRYNARATELARNLQTNLDEETTRAAKLEEMRGKPGTSNVILGKPITETFIRENAKAPINAGASDLNGMIDILRAASTANTAQ